MRFSSHMKKIFSLLAAVVSILAVSCTTNVSVDSQSNPIGTYDNLTGDFYGQVYGKVPEVFDATNIALRKNFSWFGTGENARSDTKRMVRVRTDNDSLVLVKIVQLEDNMCEIRVENEGDLMYGQKIFNEIARETRKITGR